MHLQKVFDYEVESDDEWEEEEPGESLHGSDDEKEKESEDDYEVDNEFFVPHGHLSDEEMQNEDEIDDNSPEAQKVKLKLRQDEFNDEMKKKTEKIKPRLIGCIWVNETGGCPENCPEVFWDLLQFRAVLSAGPIVLRSAPQPDADGDDDADAEDNEGEKTNRRKGHSLMEEEIRELIRLVHGNVNASKFLVKEFQAYREKKSAAGVGGEVNGDSSSVKIVTNMSILRKIKEIASYVNGAWAVQTEFLEKYGMIEYPLVNKWEYVLTPKRTEKKPPTINSPQVTGTPTPQAAPTDETVPQKTPVRPAPIKESPPSAKQQKPQSRNSITQFTKVLTIEEKQKQFQAISSASQKPPAANENKAPTPIAVKRKTVSADTTGATPPPNKKRVPLLMSVPRGQAISEQSKSQLIKNFLDKQPEVKQDGTEESVTGESSATPAVLETIVLD